MDSRRSLTCVVIAHQMWTLRRHGTLASATSASKLSILHQPCLYIYTRPPYSVKPALNYMFATKLRTLPSKPLSSMANIASLGRISAKTLSEKLIAGLDETNPSVAVVDVRDDGTLKKLFFPCLMFCIQCCIKLLDCRKKNKSTATAC